MREAIRICNENVYMYINFKHIKLNEIKFHPRVAPYFFMTDIIINIL